ncbi:MAG: Immunity repressor protein [Bacteroidetes bacterium]|nr:Immunity repressor protein [Bacteroidota bacterium]
MNVASRMRKLRELMGWKQSAVASMMNITQQAFSFLEQGNGSPRIDTLMRFCDVMNIQLHFLLSADVPITEETVRKYGAKTYSEFISEHQKLEQGAQFLDQMLLSNADKVTAIHLANTTHQAA